MSKQLEFSRKINRDIKLMEAAVSLINSKKETKPKLPNQAKTN